ncbi:MAG: hypothetical protein QOJ57_313 [Thermoleophilaceae bacterium]|nr:hypothetical protein [Thermoleophilaceae bacterium]
MTRSVLLRRGFWCLIACACAVVFPASAFADPPPNDDRADAQVIGAIPSTTDGTTAESTREDEEPGSCGQNDGSVWYRVQAQKKGRVIVSLTANGALDALVDIYRVRRSQLTSFGCAFTNEKGKAELAFRVPKAGDTFLIRVSQQVGSASDTFQLALEQAPPAAAPPGAPLPAGGATGTLDLIRNPSVAYSIPMQQGVTYRFHMAPAREACTPFLIYPPGTKKFAGATPVRRLPCGGYTLFTPRGGQDGTYTLLARAPQYSGPARFKLTGGRAGVDDTTPGRFIGNYARVRGALAGGGLDVVDLYRFDVLRRSALRVGVASKAGFELRLLRDTGHMLRASTGEIRTTVPKGRYYLAVRAEPRTSGTYTLTRLSRTLTRTLLSADRHSSSTVKPGETVRLGVAVKPADSGPVRVVIERFDPLEGWQFSRRYMVVTDRDGKKAIAWKPPSVGRYRALASFLGTRRSSPSASGYVKVHVEAPLRA